MSWIDHLQWPALVVTVIAAWMVSFSQRTEREAGFWLFLLSNILWAAWGISDEAYALVLLQFCLAIANIHGVLENRATQKMRRL